MRIVAGIVLAMLPVLPLLAQTSSLQGIVTDAQGSVVPAAVITATNQTTSSVRRGISDSKGEYVFAQMPPGPYKVEATNPGFREYATVVTLQTDTPATLNIKMEVGKVTEVVNVEGQAAVVNTENATVGNPFTETQIKEIPMQVRNVVSLLGVQPGVASSGQVSGARPDQNNVLLDGADVNDNQGSNGFNSVLPIPLDSVQEFRTTVTGFTADEGHSSGGQVSVITKSGSNSFHGSLYEYNRNTDFEANSWFNNRSGVARPALIRNQYGASVGGPIRKNKLFFFFNYEGRTDRSDASVSRTVPTDTFKQGIILAKLKTGQTAQLNPSDIAAIDPLHLGESTFMQNLFKQYPEGNAPQLSSDLGLNFNVDLFNAPEPINQHPLVARMDYNIDEAGKHTVMLRGTLNYSAQVSSPEEFPGQSAAQQSQDNSRGMAARYTAVLTSHLVNVLSYGQTRLGNNATGTETVIPAFYFANLAPTSRPSIRIAPTQNITDDATWTKGRHTVQFGVNLRAISNDRQNYGNVPGYSFNRNTLLGLGADIDGDVTTYLQPQYGSGVALSSSTNVTNALGAMLGLVNQYSATYNYTVKGATIPFGSPVTTVFAAKAVDEYAMDTFKWKPNLTVTFGLRYSIDGVPYERNGNEVVASTSLNQYFAQRVGAQALGIPGFSLPDALVSYAPGGPVNDGSGYYPTDYHDIAPRLAIAYATPGGTPIEKVLGKGSVLRAGAGKVYDHYGATMAADLASAGSPGLATAQSQLSNSNFTSAPRYTGGSLPTIPSDPFTGFPYTPAPIVGGFTTYDGVADNLKAPYEYTLSAHYARPLPHKLSLEVGYIGRLGHREIVNEDYGQPLTLFRDSKSGQTIQQAGIALANVYNSNPGLTAGQVKANPGMVPTEPALENLFPGAKNDYITGNSSANFFYDWYFNYSGSFLDTINDMDRIRLSNGGCISVFGCNTLYALQNSGLETFTNNGTSNYQAGTVVLRRTVQNGWGFDFNYTLSHSIDNDSSSESSGGGALQDAFNPRGGLGPSDFDQRQTISADGVFELPFGKGKMLLPNANRWLDAFVGGWLATTLVTFNTGTPISLSASGVYNVNYEYSSWAMLLPGATMPASHFGFDNNGQPSMFANTDAINSFVASYPGSVGTRGIIRGPQFFDADVAFSKFFRIKERQRVQIRAEAFNLLNHVNFSNPSSTSIYSPTTFGEITSQVGASSTTSSGGPRVFQFALRYEF
jgi:hypothetical protein